MEQARHQRVPGNAFGKTHGLFGRSAEREGPGLCEIANVDGMEDEEAQPPDRRNPDQEPGDVDGDDLPPWVGGPLQKSAL